MAQDASYPFAYSKYDGQAFESKVQSLHFISWFSILTHCNVYFSVRDESIPIFKIFDTNVNLLVEKANAIYAKISFVRATMAYAICNFKGSTVI